MHNVRGLNTITGKNRAFSIRHIISHSHPDVTRRGRDDRVSQSRSVLPTAEVYSWYGVQCFNKARAGRTLHKMDRIYIILACICAVGKFVLLDTIFLFSDCFVKILSSM